MTVAKATVDAVGRSAEGLLTRLLGGAADEIGQLLTERAKSYRQRRMAATLSEADAKIKASGLEPVPIPLNTLVPMLELCSLVEDPKLSSMWAGLLASAGTGNTEAQHPSFPRLLAELTPREAQMIQRVFESDDAPVWPLWKGNFAEEFGCSTKEIASSYGNVARLGIWSLTDGPRKTVVLKFDEFGRSFIAAVQGPAPSSPDSP